MTEVHSEQIKMDKIGHAQLCSINVAVTLLKFFSHN